MRDLTSVGIFGRKKIYAGQASGGLHFLGNQNFRESRVNFGYALQLENNLFLGLAANLWHWGFREKEANRTLFSFSPGLSYTIHKINIGAMAKNIGLQKMSSQYIQESIAIGLSYHKNDIRFLMEIEKFSNRDALTKVAFVYTPHPEISIQYGLSLNRFNQHIGIAYTKSKFRYEVALYYQQHLGASSALSTAFTE